LPPAGRCGAGKRKAPARLRVATAAPSSSRAVRRR
jgi:hypothetical protein